MMMESSENSIMSEVTDHVPVLLKDIPPSSSPQTVDDPLKVMQNDLHSRGTDLSKAWTSLFSLLTKYQAELTVKENQIDIAERQLETRKQQLSMLNDQVVSPDDTSKLQEQLNQKELVLSRCQQELTNTSDMLNRVQSDLSSHMQQLERARHEQLQNHEKLLNYQSEITKLKSELMLKQEEIHIKDNLVQKLQNQLVRETSDLNAEISRLKENIESHVRVLDNERRSHEQTRKSVRSLQQNKSRIGGTVQQNVIEIPDSPPTLDLSVEQHDFGLSNIISLSEQQPMEQESHSAQFRHHPYRQETVRTPPMTLSSPTQRSPVNKLGNIHSDITDRWRSSASATAASQSVSSTASDTFFPLSTSAMDASIEQQNLNIKQEPALSGSVPISGPIPGGSSSQGHQSSNDSDTGQSQLQWPDNGNQSFFPQQEYTSSHVIAQDQVAYQSLARQSLRLVMFSIPGCVGFDSGRHFHPTVIESTLQKYIRSLVKVLIEKCKDDDADREPDPLELEWLAKKIVEKYPQFKDPDPDNSHMSSTLWVSGTAQDPSFSVSDEHGNLVPVVLSTAPEEAFMPKKQALSERERMISYRQKLKEDVEKYAAYKDRDARKKRERRRNMTEEAKNLQRERDRQRKREKREAVRNEFERKKSELDEFDDTTKNLLKIAKKQWAEGDNLERNPACLSSHASFVSGMDVSLDDSMSQDIASSSIKESDQETGRSGVDLFQPMFFQPLKVEPEEQDEEEV
ncbi:uncharacterized protein LOC135488797 isoform X2 [Lineus longissimus]|uniref:uncharacterized protein LOC135488797 isoform X2 n=1 Tax=Lineus longissimus TaxID=88925 RepID=UPI00315CC6A7